MKRVRSDASVAVLQRLERLNVELESSRQQVSEVETVVSSRGGLQEAAVLEGLAQLTSNVQGLETQINGASTDHIESGREDATALAQQLQGACRDLFERIGRLRDRVMHAEGNGQMTTEGAEGDGAADDSGPQISRQPAFDGAYGIVPGVPSVAVGGVTDGSTLTGVDGYPSTPVFSEKSTGGGSAMDVAEAEEGCSVGDAMDADTSFGGPEALVSDTALYSWGRVDLGTLFRADVEGKDKEPTPAVSKYSKKNFANLCTTLYHTVAVTTTGEVYGSGVNEDGQVSPDRLEPQLSTPVLVESLLSQRVLQASCGENHTVCLTAAGTVVSFGNNEVGQLGHSKGLAMTRVAPRTVQGLSGKIIKQVSCGYLFTLLLSSDGEVFSCGIGSCAGHADAENRYVAERIASLRFVPVAYLAAGASHAVAVTVTGQVWGWGLNTNGQLGIAGMSTVQEATVISGLGNVRMAACGGQHTVFVTMAGEVMVCGKNNHGQLGFNPAEVPLQRVLARCPSLSSEGVCMVACGDQHTLALTQDRRVLAMGANASGQLGFEAEEEEGDVWTPRVVKGLEGGVNVFFIAAGGEQSFALAIREPVRSGEGGTGAGEMDELTLDILRKFSVIKPVTSFYSTQELQLLIEAAEKSDNHTALTRTLTDVFGSASLVNGSFLAANGVSRVDVMGLESIYVNIMKLSDAVLLQRLMQASSAGIGMILASSKGLADIDSLRCVLAYWQCPLNTNTSLSRESFQKLCDVIVRLNKDARTQLAEWIREDYPSHILATRLLKPLHHHMAYHLSVDYGRGRAVPILALVMSLLFQLNEERDPPSRVRATKPLIPLEQFHNDAVSSLSDESLLQDLNNWKRRQENQFTFCAFSFLFSAETKRRILNAEATMEQQVAAQRDIMRQLLHGAPVVPYLVLQVDREHLLQTTLLQIQQLDSIMLKKELKVVFAGEEGVDEGGVKKEFFQLLTDQLFDYDYGMFKLSETKREIWFNKACTWSGDEYHLVGILVGLAIYNATLLDVHFPGVVYRKLLGLPVGLADLEDLDPELMRGLTKLLEFEEAGVTVEDVFCTTFEVTWTEFDETKTYELKPGGKSIEVTAANRREYVDLYVRWVLTDSIARQFEDFKSGFNKVMGGSSISLLRPEELELLVCGTPHLNFKELEAVARYEGGYHASYPVVRWFWECVHEMTLEDQRKFLLFVCGSDRAPIGGLGKLSILIQRAGPDSENLPSSHTCFNVLLVPEYASKAKLREKLLTAIKECVGFGLR